MTSVGETRGIRDQNRSCMEGVPEVGSFLFGLGTEGSCDDKPYRDVVQPLRDESRRRSEITDLRASGWVDPLVQ